MRPYPTEVPQQAWSVVFDLLRGKVEDVPLATQVGYEVLGFALGKIVGDSPAIFASGTAASEAMEHEALAYVEARANGLAFSQDETKAAGGMWITLAVMIGKALLELLLKKN